MKRIGLLSDTHGFLDEKIFQYFETCDEIWHAGDIGSMEVANQLEEFKPLRAVHGNIDVADIRQKYPLDLRFQCEGMAIWMTHIGGYPGRYHPRIKAILVQQPPKLFICGHSHILKIMWDKTFNLWHINPGACGKEGFHQVKTIVRFSLDADTIKDMEVIELGSRGTV